MDENEETLHPRPQMARRRWIDLRGPWQFAYDDAEMGLYEDWQVREDVFTRTIIVPFPPESPASGIHDTGFHPVVWYRRTFTIEEQDKGKHLILHCGAVDYRAAVWVNGQHLVAHEGGNTPFFVDMTPALRQEGEQVIVIRAEDRPEDLGQPRGKQDWQLEPHDIWYERTTGIWQPVWIEPVSETYIQSVRWTPDLERGGLGVSVTLGGTISRPHRVRVELSLHGVPLVDDTALVHGRDLRRELQLDLGSMTMSRQHVLWAPQTPNLIDATLTLLNEDEVVDEVLSYAGLRSVSTSGGRFLLNDRPYYLRFALAQGYWPDTHLAAPSDEALRREVQLAKELGFNGVRVHQKVEDPRFLYWCDRLGLLVWGEMANAYVYSRVAVDRTVREWLEVLDRDYSHPCIVAWVPLNESWGVPNMLVDSTQQHYVRGVYHLTKSLDRTRPVIANDGWEYLLGDVFGIHDYTFWGDTIRDRYATVETVERTLRDVQPANRFVVLSGSRDVGVPFMLTEFGGISYTPQAGANWFGYGTVPDTDTFIDKYRELLDAVLDCNAIAGFCYTQLTDTAQETNGLLTAEREPKIDPAIIRTINRRASVAVPGDIVAQLRRVTASPFGGTVVLGDVEPMPDPA